MDSVSLNIEKVARRNIRKVTGIHVLRETVFDLWMKKE